jgi:hypothetical protein
LRNSKDTGLTDRRTAAADAKASLLAAYRAAKDAVGPEQAARQAERQAVAVARDHRRAEREQLKAEELERVQAEAALVDRG